LLRGKRRMSLRFLPFALQQGWHASCDPLLVGPSF
jgi:hypothetical protein